MSWAKNKYQNVTITYRKDFSPDLWTVRVKLEEPFPFRPGQYATLGIDRDPRPLERAYSIVSSPLEEELEFFFELVTYGELTPNIYDFHVGDSLLMRRQAKGLFTLDAKSGHRNHFLVSTVTGVAPYLSMARTLAREAEKGQQPHVSLFLLHAASRSWEFGYREELEALAAKFDWLTYLPTISRPWEDQAWQGEVGRAEDVLRKYLDSFGLSAQDTTVYLCGHPQMIENSKGILQRRGFSRESVREELYWVPKKAAK
jgi:ferredoxin/flavodoxin---NADP+ reductase